MGAVLMDDKLEELQQYHSAIGFDYAEKKKGLRLISN